MKVYLAGPIAGCDKGEANDWRQDFIRDFEGSGIVGVSPLRCEPLIGDKYELQYDDVRFGTPSAISGKNWFDTVNCDLILAYLPSNLSSGRPSYGTIIELGWAIGLRKPIVLVAGDHYITQHPLIKDNVNWVVDNFDDAYDIVNGLLEVYV